MLTARNVPKACQSCRWQLLSLFEHGFTQSATSNISRSRYSTQNRQRSQTSQVSRVRAFHSSKIRSDEIKKDVPVKVYDDAAVTEVQTTESVVRQARQTFGETLPKDYLSAEEYRLYERLYGPPLRETTAEDLMYLPGGEDESVDEAVTDVLLRQLPNGDYEEVEFDPKHRFNVTPEELEGSAQEKEGLLKGEEIESVETEIQYQVQNRRELKVIKRLQKDMDAAIQRSLAEKAAEKAAQQAVAEDEIVFEEEDIEDEPAEDEERFDSEMPHITADQARTHPHTMAGRFGTSPSTVYLPKLDFVEPITELLTRVSNKHLDEACEKAFGGKGLPHSPSTSDSCKLAPQKHIGLDAAQNKMSEIEADAFMAAVMPQTYTAAYGTLIEVRKRLGTKWLRDLLSKERDQGPRVLDAGAGGAGSIAWQEMVRAEWELMREDGTAGWEEAPPDRTTVLTGPDTLRHRMSRFLDDTTFISRLPDYLGGTRPEDMLHGGQSRKVYDIIIAPHLLLPLKEEFRRKQIVDNLWSLLDPNGGVLIMLEKGLPRGFEAIAGARSRLLKKHIASPEDTHFENELESPDSEVERYTAKGEGMIIAPCTNHTKCPMYPVPGLSSGRKDFCHFNQRFIRPPFLQRIIGATSNNHEDVRYSYISVRKGVDARLGKDEILHGDVATDRSFEGFEDHDLPNEEWVGNGEDARFSPYALPRTVLPPLKRTGHVTLDLCTPSGKLERWVVPKSFSKTAYRDARKSKWGDLWALGAKTRVPRSARLGRAGQELNIKKSKAGKIPPVAVVRAKDKFKKNQMDMVVGQKGFEGIEERRGQNKFVKREKRTKGGRIWRPKDRKIQEEDL